MSTQLKLRRGTTVQHSTFTGASGEITVDTNKTTAVVHDGATAGGVPLLTENKTQTITNKSLDLGSNTVTGTKAQWNAACTDADFATLTGTETLTGKTLNLASNTLTGTKAQFDAACSDADFIAAGLIGSSGLTMNTAKLLGRTTAAAGAVEEIAIGSGLSLSGGTLSNTASSAVASVNGATGAVTADQCLVSQTGNSGKFLKTNGTTASWTALASADVTTALTYTPMKTDVGALGVGAIVIGFSGSVASGATVAGSSLSILGFNNGYGDLSTSGGTTWNINQGTAGSGTWRNIGVTASSISNSSIFQRIA